MNNGSPKTITPDEAVGKFYATPQGRFGELFARFDRQIYHCSEWRSSDGEDTGRHIIGLGELIGNGVAPAYRFFATLEEAEKAVRDADLFYAGAVLEAERR